MRWIYEASVSLSVKWGHKTVPRKNQLLAWKQPPLEADAE